MDDNVMLNVESDVQQQDGDVEEQNVGNENLMMPVKKRVIKLTSKGWEMFLVNTQKTRNLKCRQAKRMVEMMKELMKSNENANKIKGYLHELKILCDEANACQNSLKGLLPEDEINKQEQWLKFKMDKLSSFAQDAEIWLNEIKQSSHGNGQQMTSFIVLQDGKQQSDTVSIHI